MPTNLEQRAPKHMFELGMEPKDLFEGNNNKHFKTI